MLVLAVHTVNTVTAKVAFATILLQDYITNKKVPAEFKCRQLIPSSGSKSCSLWDVSDAEALLAWLNENINVDCEHEIFEVQEDFGIGFGEVQRQRAAERVATGTKDVAKAVGAAGTATVHAVQDIDSKLRISERAGHAMGAVRDSSVVQATGAALTKAGSTVKAATGKVFEQPAVASATEVVGSGFKKLGASLSKVITRKNSEGATGELPEHIDADPITVNAPAPQTTTNPPPPPPSSLAP